MQRSFESQGACARRWCAALLLGLAIAGGLVLGASQAHALMLADGLPPVLILDAGLGDAAYYQSHWLGEAESVATRGGLRLVRSKVPRWFAGAGAPATYLLYSQDTSGTSTVVDAEAIAWALDAISQKEPEPKTVLVAQGATGIQARRYLGDLASPRQSNRADVVGLVMLGTPNKGLSLAERYAELDMWEPFAQRAGLALGDLSPESPLLVQLNAAALPAVLKTLVVKGAAFSVEEGETDGVLAVSDSELATGVVTGPLDYVTVRSRASRAWPLRDTWFKATKRGGANSDLVDPRAVERIAPTAAYVTSNEVQGAVRRYYSSWFSDGAPVTHISSRVIIDTSGSMGQRFGSGKKIDAAKVAARDFVGAMEDRQLLPGVVPEDIALIAFNKSASMKADVGSSPGAVKAAVKRLKPKGTTDIGDAIEMGVASFKDSPATADKVIVLLSDGVNTAGLNEKRIMSGPVAKAAKNDIRIETILLGGEKTKGAGFLKKLAKETGGTFHQSRSAYELRRDFLRARFSSLGTVTVDSAMKPGDSRRLLMDSQGGTLRLAEIGIVPDGSNIKWRLLRDKQEVDRSELTVTESPNGIVYIAAASPAEGDYRLELLDGSKAKRAHVFTVTQEDTFKQVTAAPPNDTTPATLLVLLGVAGLVSLIVTVVISRRKKDHGTGQVLGAPQPVAESIPGAQVPNTDQIGGQ